MYGEKMYKEWLLETPLELKNPDLEEPLLEPLVKTKKTKKAEEAEPKLKVSLIQAETKWYELSEAGLMPKRTRPSGTRKGKQELLDEIRVHPTFDDNLYNSQTILYPNHENIRICDPIKSNIYTTTDSFKLLEGEDSYKFSFKLNGINGAFWSNDQVEAAST